jgi:predicted nucleic acid-binding Zn ribbon protein
MAGCVVCEMPLPAPKAGQRRRYCGTRCKRRAENDRRRHQRHGLQPRPITLDDMAKLRVTL